ncbi:MAG: hypothetical protein RSA57_03760 [Cetobacterium sp.]|uniref:pLS20_p028 family conjugation system transmembrane protein n=1 Tax=Bacteria TaxID=2 RepID=UPI002FC609CB
MELIIGLSKSGILEISDMCNVVLRSLGWFLIKGLAIFVNGLENTVTKIYTINGFFASEQVTELINKYKPLIWMILAISIGILGIKIVFNKKQNREHIPSNLIFSVCVIVLLPIFMTKLSTMTTIAVSDLSGYSSTANEIIKNSLYDLYYLDDTSYDMDGLKNNIPDSTILHIDINESLDTKNISATNKDSFKKKIDVGDDGNITLVDLNKGWFSWDEEYYRYNIDFIIVIITLGTTAITLGCIGLKVARLIFELAFNKLFATLFAFADIDDGKKIREIVKHIGCIFAVLFSMSVILKLYIIFNAWLSSGSTSSIDQITKIVTLIGVSIAVIDGPNIVERVLGIDAGLKSGLGTMMGAYGATKGVASTVRSASKLAGAAGSAMGKAGIAGAGLAGITSGAVNGKSDNNSNSGKQSESDTSNGGTKTLEDQMDQNNSSKDTKVNSKEDSNFKNENVENQMKNNKSNDNINNENKEKDMENGDTSSSPNMTLQDQMNNTNPKDNTLGASERSLENQMNDGNQKDNNKNDSMNNDIRNMERATDNSLENQMNDSNPKDSNSNDSMSNDIGNMSGTSNDSLETQMNDSNINDIINNDSSNIPGTPDNSLENQMKNNSSNDNINNNIGTISEEQNNSLKSSEGNSESKNNNHGNSQNETRTLGQYVRGTKGIASVERAYNIGKNTSSKWNLPEKIKSTKNRRK